MKKTSPDQPLKTKCGRGRVVNITRKDWIEMLVEDSTRGFPKRPDLSVEGKGLEH